MPTCMRVGPYRLFFYSNDAAEPLHIHVERERSQALVVSGLGFMAWMLLLRFGTSLLLSSTVLAWALAAVVCIPALVLEGRLYRRLSA